MCSLCPDGQPTHLYRLLVLRKRNHLHSYPVRTSRGTAACEAVAPSGPARSISLALLWTVRATGGDTVGGERDMQNRHKPHTVAGGWIALPSEMVSSAGADGLQGPGTNRRAQPEPDFLPMLFYSCSLCRWGRPGCGRPDPHSSAGLLVPTPHWPWKESECG